MKNKKVIKTILKSLLVVAVIVAIALCGYFILQAIGFRNADDFIKLRNDLGNSFLFWIIIGLLQIFQVIFIPISNQLITVPLALCFPKNELWKVFLCSWLSIWIATLILYFIGRFGGGKLLKWLLGDKEETEKCKNFLKKGWMFYPLGMLLPLPDDIITILSGTAKMNFVFILGCSFITRAIDVATSVFGFGILTRYWWGWIIIGVFFVGLIIVSIIFFKKQNKKV